MAGAAAITVGAAVGVTAMASGAQTTTGCQVAYSITNQWPGGFGANVTVTNLGDPVSNWQLKWSFGAGQTITQLWSGSYAQNGAQVTVSNASWNGSIPTNGNASFGFNGSWTNGANPTPTSFALNGVTCTGSPSGGGTTPPPTSPPPTSPPPTSPPPTSPPPTGGSLPSSFRWSSSGPLITPKSDASHNLVAVKDPSVVYYNGRWNVFASTVNSSGGYGMEYLSFTDWSQAASAPQYYLDQSGIGGGYRAAPEIFYFAPQHMWYLVYQTGNASYSTNPDISNPSGWSAPKNFYNGEPSIIQQNIGSGYWVDMSVTCDTANCYLFSSDDNGHLYRSQTSLASFPNGMSQPVIAMQDSNPYNLFEASHVYTVSGSNTYLLMVECIGSDGHRYFRSWTSPSIAGPYTPLADTVTNPLAGPSNVSFSGTPWTQDISHGDLIRSGYDQTLTISPCKLQFLYQGKDPSAGGDYNHLPWRLGLLTQTNSPC